MHENSLNAYKEQNPTLNKRCLEVLAAIMELKVATDLQIMEHLGYTDPNKVRPRVTDLKKAGIIEELPEKVRNPESGVSSRQVRLKMQPSISGPHEEHKENCCNPQSGLHELHAEPAKIADTAPVMQTVEKWAATNKLAGVVLPSPQEMAKQEYVLPEIKPEEKLEQPNLFDLPTPQFGF